MRRIIALTVCLFLILGSLVLIAQNLSRAKDEPVYDEPTEDRETVAMWLSQFDLSPIMTENGTQREQKDYTQKIDATLDFLKQNGINTLFVQLRPNGDSIYPSELFPSSAYAVGRTGAPFSYDPFSILLSLAHEKGFSVHGWINPLRIFTDATKNALTEDYPHLSFCQEDDPRASLVGSTWYLNPAEEEVRTLIAKGVREILQLYPVDGIHIDDYFYPTTDPFFDGISYESYRAGGGIFSLADFRRESVNRLVSLLYETVHTTRKNCQFGVSPSGNIQRNYEELYADVAYWCSHEGYVDYLCPQIYFGMEHGTHDFSSVAEDFDRMIEVDGIELYLGMTLEKAYNGYYGKEDPYAGSGRREWIEHRDVLLRCLTSQESLTHKRGVAFFGFRCLVSPETTQEEEALREEWSHLLPHLLASQKN